MCSISFQSANHAINELCFSCATLQAGTGAFVFCDLQSYSIFSAVLVCYTSCDLDSAISPALLPLLPLPVHQMACIQSGTNGFVNAGGNLVPQQPQQRMHSRGWQILKGKWSCRLHERANWHFCWLCCRKLCTSNTADLGTDLGVSVRSMSYTWQTPARPGLKL